MSSFIKENFLLHSDLAEKLYQDFAKKLPIIDYHNHLSPEQIRTNHNFEDITAIWLQGDHYKWRAMRATGTPERYITGHASSYEKFEKWAETVPQTLRNPLYHWTHMELQNPFGIDALLSKETALTIYRQTKEQLATKEFSTQSLLNRFNVEFVGTTDDPIDDLENHRLIKENKDFQVSVSPTFRPDKAFAITSGNAFRSYVTQLSIISEEEITSLDTLISALKKRADKFDQTGCVASDHGLKYLPKRSNQSRQKINQVFINILHGDDTEAAEIEDDYIFEILAALCEIYHDKNWVQQFHLGPLRNTNTQKLSLIGADGGYDSIGDFRQAERMSQFFNHLEQRDKLAKTVIYNVNPADNAVFASMTGNFQGEGIKGKIQFGSGWWYMDQLDGMRDQINTLSNLGLVSCFIGMLTDSRSFLSYSRHEYFRRLVCNIFADDVLKGYLPNDIPLIGSIISDICYYNAKQYFKEPIFT